MAILLYSKGWPMAGPQLGAVFLLDELSGPALWSSVSLALMRGEVSVLRTWLGCSRLQQRYQVLGQPASLL